MPDKKIRQEGLAQARRVVIKLGTQLITRTDRPGSTELDIPYIQNIASQIHELNQKKIEVTLVSSGSIGAGCSELGLAKRPEYVSDQQAIAAVGQRLLMTHMHDAFSPHGMGVGQVLLTRNDFDDRLRYLNIRNCISRLHRYGCIPILNENDAVAIDELRFGDNDLLAALVCNALRADALILLTVVDGLLDEQDKRVEVVRDMDDALEVARDDTTAMGTGGIVAKLKAAKLVMEAGEIAVIANGREPDVLPRLFEAESLGTLFVPSQRKLTSRQRWIGLTKRSSGTVTIDSGAAQALIKNGKSLLAIGIVDVSSGFERGQVVAVVGPEGDEIARGLSNYSANEVRQIMGVKSDQIEEILGSPAYASVIHRDNLVLTGT